MTEKSSGAASPAVLPYALFMGDFNVGKSTLLNALLRHDLLFVSRQESRPLTTFIQRSHGRSPRYLARTASGTEIANKSHEEFLSLRQDMPGADGYRALGAQLPSSPFQQLVLVDTAGASSDTCERVEIADLPDQDGALMVVVTDIEYWASKHNMDFIARHLDSFGENLIVVANKADHLNASEIDRICSKAAKRMDQYGIDETPPFYAVSARLELARKDERDEYRRRTKPTVRTRCDAGFDALRVKLYEFEAAQARRAGAEESHEFLTAPLADAFVEKQKGAVDAIS